MPELKPLPCPFCGGTAVSIAEGSTFRWRELSCDACGATCGETRVQTMWSGTADEWEKQVAQDAIKDWNCRPHPAAPSITGIGTDKPRDVFPTSYSPEVAAHADGFLAAKPAAPSVAPEPVAWTLQSELDAAQTTCSAHLWFTNPRNSAWTALFTREKIAAHPPRAPLQDEHPYTYASTQATNCAGCGEYKHTPLRIDAMGGYVCLTCIDGKLGTLLGEFGYPPRAPLTSGSIAQLYEDLQTAVAGHDTPLEMFTFLARSVEAAHGIGGK